MVVTCALVGGVRVNQYKQLMSKQNQKRFSQFAFYILISLLIIFSIFPPLPMCLSLPSLRPSPPLTFYLSFLPTHFPLCLFPPLSPFPLFLPSFSLSFSLSLSPFLPTSSLSLFPAYGKSTPTTPFLL